MSKTADSDIERQQAAHEHGFYLGQDEEQKCPLCGLWATPDDPDHSCTVREGEPEEEDPC